MSASSRAGVNLFAFIMGLMPFLVSAQGETLFEDKEAILRIVDEFYEAIANRDRETLISITIPGSLNFSIADPVKSAGDFTVINYSQLINNLSLDGPELAGQYSDPVIMIEGNIAIFWAHYDFFINQQFDHCGVDSFQLVKQDGSWFISNISSTRRNEGCN